MPHGPIGNHDQKTREGELASRPKTFVSRDVLTGGFFSNGKCDQITDQEGKS